MVTPTNHVIARGAWHFGDYRNIFLPNIGEGQKNLTSDGWAPGIHGKSGPGIALRL